MSLADFATPSESRDATVTVLNPESECPVYQLLSKLFNDEAITIQEASTDGDAIPSDAVLVERGDEDAGFAVSPLDAIRNELLLVNSDIYVTGSRELDDVETPDAITHLDEIPFTVTGYPESPKEKLLLIEISRHIEALAWQAGEGRLVSGFQYLSRLDDEKGTRQVYSRLGAETEVDTHVYGVPDADPTLPEITMHGIDAQELRQSWFVVYESAHHSHEAAALIATERESNTWEGCWTYDTARVTEIFEYLSRTYD